MKSLSPGTLNHSIRWLATAIPKAWFAVVHYQPAWPRTKPEARTSLVHDDFPDDHWTLDDASAADAEGWNIYDAGGVLEIERNDTNDVEGATFFPTDDDARDHVTRRALEGSEMHQRALKIDQKYRDWGLHLVMCGTQRIGAWEAPAEALWMAFEASETAKGPAIVSYNGEQMATVIAGPASGHRLTAPVRALLIGKQRTGQ
jgi:hypothetical protein